MPDSYSFDVASEVDIQEADNAINQARKEIDHRYDLKGSNSSIEFSTKEKTYTVRAEGEHFVNSVLEIIRQKFIKRGISILALNEGKMELLGGKSVRCVVTLKNGMERDEAKKITVLIKESKMKVQAQVHDEVVRITGKSKDDLQQAMEKIKSADLGFPIQFTNYR